MKHINGKKKGQRKLESKDSFQSWGSSHLVIQSNMKTTIKAVYLLKYSHTFYTKMNFKQWTAIAKHEDIWSWVGYNRFPWQMANSSRDLFYSLGQFLCLVFYSHNRL